MRIILFAFCALAFGALGDAALAQSRGCGVNQDRPEIAGAYIDNFGGVQIVSAPAWVSGTFLFYVCSVDNSRRRLVAQNLPRNGDTANLFSRFEWTTNSSGQLFYCQQVYNAASPADADAAAQADPRNPFVSGCGANGQFPWTQIIRIVPAGGP